MTPEESARYAKHEVVAASRRARAKRPEPQEEPPPGVVVASIELMDDGLARFSCLPGFEEQRLLDAMTAAIAKRREELTVT